MAALKCMSAFSPRASRTNSRSPAGRASPEVAIDASAAICWPSSRRWDATSLTWNRPSGIQEFRARRGFNFRFRASIVGQEGESGTLSGEGSTSSGSPVGLVQVPRRAADVVREYYDRMNQRDYLGVANLFVDECEYEDFNFFSNSKKGKEEVLKFLEKAMSSFGSDLKFVVDDMTLDDPNAVGVLWHLDWRGKAFPFSRGCSFYRCVLNSAGERQIRFGRDIVEPAVKPGDVSMGALRLVIGLFERFPQLANRL